MGSIKKVDLLKLDNDFKQAMKKPTAASAIGAFLMSSYGNNKSVINIDLVFNVNKDVSFIELGKSLPFKNYEEKSFPVKDTLCITNKIYGQTILFRKKGICFCVALDNDKTYLDEDSEISVLFLTVAKNCVFALKEITLERNDDTDFEDSGSFWSDSDAQKCLLESINLYEKNKDVFHYRGFMQLYKIVLRAKQWKSSSLFKN